MNDRQFSIFMSVLVDIKIWLFIISISILLAGC